MAFNTEIDHKVGLDDQWIYFPSKDLTLTRASFPENFSPYMVPEGKSGVCVEITSPGPADMEFAASKQENIINDLEKVGLCGRQNILDIHIEPVDNTYPLYELGYIQEKERVKEALSSFANVGVAGRTGLFWYNHMDNSIGQALQLADELAPESDQQD